MGALLSHPPLTPPCEISILGDTNSTMHVVAFPGQEQLAAVYWSGTSPIVWGGS